MIRRLLFVIVVVSLIGIADSRASQREQRLEQAIDSYNQGFAATDRDERLRHFRRAELLFEQAIAGEEGASTDNTRLENAEVYMNLGNAALGAERIGPAIVAYRHAIKLDPNHRRAQQNIEHARTLLPRWVPRPEDEPFGVRSFFGWTQDLSQQQSLKLAALMFLVAALLLALSIRFERSGLRNLAIFPAVAWLLLLALAFLGTNSSSTIAVVVLPETIARSADSVNSPERFPEPLPSGTEVEIIEDRTDWQRIRLFDGRDAWLPTNSLAVI